MSETNKKTLASYEAHITQYIDGTPQDVTGDVKTWIDATLLNLSPAARILEVGYAFGRDANYIESQGYSVERSDATLGFVEYLQQQGHEARQLNILEDAIQEKYDLVFANAVLLHFNREEVQAVIRKVNDSLNPGGLFSFSLKQGTGEEWSDAKLGAARYFCYWEDAVIKGVLARAGFHDISSQEGELGRNNAKWLHIIAKK